jgi:hypothetical protein
LNFAAFIQNMLQRLHLLSRVSGKHNAIAPGTEKSVFPFRAAEADCTDLSHD